ncbi:GNAT family N-acetyltransferase [Microbacterium suaedae]|uniref:GNAT family N-acetyltransferase n=1 Tax=Microbacterium suaedae TaxID=2067813 RepID=UPI000DA145EA|nr:GNAT family N-acetyltransferase [Microbacterium suaedae]
MTIELTPVAAERFSTWLERSRDEYVADLVASGETPESALRHATEALARAFPEQAPMDGQAVFDLTDDSGDAVGYLWLGHDNSGDPTSWWVWDVVVEPEHRGKGYGRAAMQLAETYAQAGGARTLGLSVFGFNATARALYDSLGYETTSVKMRKRLEDPELQDDLAH